MSSQSYISKVRESLKLEPEVEDNTVEYPCESSLPRLEIPKHIGSYIIQKEIGRGAFGIVCIGTHSYTEETVAIKILDKLALSETPEDIELLEKEISILKIVKHKYIVQLYEIIETPRYIYIVMEYCEGKDLIDYILPKRHLSESESLKYFQQLITALIYLHSQNIAHRDIKIDNMLLDKKLNLKLVDFGLSTKYRNDEFLKQPCGTVVYAAPEVLEGKKYQGMKADVWSSGIVLYGMIAGYLPFSDSDDEINKKYVLKGKFVIPKNLPSLVIDLLNHMLDMNPDTRYSLDDIVRHPWFNGEGGFNLLPGVVIGMNRIPVDNKILGIIEKYGIDVNKVKFDLINNNFNSETSTYYLLVKKYKDLGYDSVSDMCSKEFIEFITEKNNKIYSYNYHPKGHNKEDNKKFDINNRKNDVNFMDDNDDIILNDSESAFVNEKSNDECSKNANDNNNNVVKNENNKEKIKMNDKEYIINKINIIENNIANINKDLRKSDPISSKGNTKKTFNSSTKSSMSKININDINTNTTNNNNNENLKSSNINLNNINTNKHGNNANHIINNNINKSNKNIIPNANSKINKKDNHRYNISLKEQIAKFANCKSPDSLYSFRNDKFNSGKSIFKENIKKQNLNSAYSKKIKESQYLNKNSLKDIRKYNINTASANNINNNNTKDQLKLKLKLNNNINNNKINESKFETNNNLDNIKSGTHRNNYNNNASVKIYIKQKSKINSYQNKIRVNSLTNIYTKNTSSTKTKENKPIKKNNNLNININANNNLTNNNNNNKTSRVFSEVNSKSIHSIINKDLCLNKKLILKDLNLRNNILNLNKQIKLQLNEDSFSCNTNTYNNLNCFLKNEKFDTERKQVNIKEKLSNSSQHKNKILRNNINKLNGLNCTTYINIFINNNNNNSTKNNVKISTSKSNNPKQSYSQQHNNTNNESNKNLHNKNINNKKVNFNSYNTNLTNSNTNLNNNIYISKKFNNNSRSKNKEKLLNIDSITSLSNTSFPIYNFNKCLHKDSSNNNYNYNIYNNKISLTSRLNTVNEHIFSRSYQKSMSCRQKKKTYTNKYLESSVLNNKNKHPLNVIKDFSYSPNNHYKKNNTWKYKNLGIEFKLSNESILKNLQKNIQKHSNRIQPKHKIKFNFIDKNHQNSYGYKTNILYKINKPKFIKNNNYNYNDTNIYNISTTRNNISRISLKTDINKSVFEKDKDIVKEKIENRNNKDKYNNINNNKKSKQHQPKNKRNYLNSIQEKNYISPFSIILNTKNNFNSTRDKKDNIFTSKFDGSSSINLNSFNNENSLINISSNINSTKNNLNNCICNNSKYYNYYLNVYNGPIDINCIINDNNSLDDIIKNLIKKLEKNKIFYIKTKPNKFKCTKNKLCFDIEILFINCPNFKNEKLYYYRIKNQNEDILEYRKLTQIIIG